ncbi:MAG: cell surface protein [Alistipes sp.]|nr:cell surface protein [Alistipes sp.]
MRRFLEFIFLSVLAIITSSCNRDEVLTADLPEIIIEGDGIYSVAVGEEIRLAPDYRNADDATFEWRIGDDVVGTERAYVFMAEEAGEVYITITVTTDAGNDTEELRIDVTEPDTPAIDIAMEDITVAVGYKQTITATVRKTEHECEIRWTVNDEEVATDVDSYEFEATEVGTYRIVATATNPHGEASDSVTIEVVNAEDLDLIYEFEATEYHITEGRTLIIRPSAINKSEGVTFLWILDGEEQGANTNMPHFLFNSSEVGKHTLEVKATTYINTPIEVSHTFSVEVIEEGKYRRERTATSASVFSRVVEYLPAPGQFIGDTKTGGFTGEELTAEDARIYAEERLHQNNWVSLGAFGGSIVVVFDHSIANNDDYDFAIKGNSFDGSSEPGIVWVMQDENGNGLADDTWYELKGSETGKGSTYQDYEVTYYRPISSGMPVAWSDNKGGSGTIDYLSSFHNQPSYYPTWIGADSYTLRGTRLEARNYDKSGNGSMWVQPAYDWGYADNYSERDCVDAENSFDISNAIDILGKPIELEYIDFVKVQSAVQSKSGWLGELSTEVCNFVEIVK